MEILESTRDFIEQVRAMQYLDVLPYRPPEGVSPARLQNVLSRESERSGKRYRSIIEAGVVYVVRVGRGKP